MDAITLAAQLSAAYGVEVEPEDLVLIDGGWSIDGMEPREWIDALYGDND